MRRAALWTVILLLLLKSANCQEGDEDDGFEPVVVEESVMGDEVMKILELDGGAGEEEMPEGADEEGDVADDDVEVEIEDGAYDREGPQVPGGGFHDPAFTPLVEDDSEESISIGVV